MTPWARRFLVVAGLAGVLTMALPLLERFMNRHIIRYPYAVGRLDDAEYARLASAPGWATSSVETAPGIRLRGLVRRPARDDAPWIFFLTGNDRTPLTTAQRFLDTVRGPNDWGAAVYAYRGYDSSDGEPARDAIADDMLAAYRQLLQREHLAPSRVHMAAFSLGAYFAASVASRAAPDERPRSLTLLGPAADIYMVHTTWSAALSAGDRIRTLPLLSALRLPAQVLQGADDQTTGVAQGKAAAEALHATYREFPGIGHTDVLERDAPAEALRAFVAEQAAPAHTAQP